MTAQEGSAVARSVVFACECGEVMNVRYWRGGRGRYLAAAPARFSFPTPELPWPHLLARCRCGKWLMRALPALADASEQGSARRRARG